jgi:hypothetical protein
VDLRPGHAVAGVAHHLAGIGTLEVRVPAPNLALPPIEC